MTEIERLREQLKRLRLHTMANIFLKMKLPKLQEPDELHRLLRPIDRRRSGE